MTKVFPTSRSFGSLVDVLFSAALEEYGRDAETLDFSNILCVCSSPVLVRESQRIFHHVAASKFPGRECYIPPRIVIPVQLSRDAYAVAGKRRIVSNSFVPLILSRLSKKAMGYASLLQNFIRELLWTFPLRTIEEIRVLFSEACSELNIPESLSQRIIECLGIFEKYRLFLHKRGMIDDAEVLAEYLNHPPREKWRVLILNGFLDPDPLERIFLDHLIRQAETVLIGSLKFDNNYNIANSYIDILNQHIILEMQHTPPDLKGSEAAPKELVYYAFDDRESEVEGIAKSIKSLCASGKLKDLERVIIATPDLDTYAPLFERILRKYGIPFDLRRMKPLREVGPFRDLLCLLAAVNEDYPRLPFAQFLASPYFRKIPDSLRQWMPLFSVQSGIISGRDAWLDFVLNGTEEIDPVFLQKTGITEDIQLVFAALKELEVMKSSSTFHHYRSVLMKTLDNLGFLTVLSSAGGDANESVSGQDERKAFQKLMNQVSLLGGLFPESSVSLTEFIEVLVHLMQAPIAEDEGEGVRILDMASVLETAPTYLYVGGLTDDALPRHPQMDYFLPDSLRKRMGLADFERKLDIQGILFQHGIESAHKMHLSYPLTDGDRLLLPSPFLYSGRQEEGGTPGIFSREEYLLSKGKNPLTSCIFEIRGEPYRFPADRYLRVTDIDAYRFCPRKFYVEKVAGITPLEVKEYEIEAMTLGSILHKIMEKIVPVPLSGLAEFKSRTIAVIDEILAGRKLSPYWRGLVRDTFLEILPDIYQRECEMRTEEYVSSDVEKPVTGEPVPGIRLRGKIDRIDKVGKGYQILDYKTGSPALNCAQITQGNEYLQLFLYAAIMKYQGYPVRRAGIYSLKDIRIKWCPPERKGAGRGGTETIDDYILASLRFLEESVGSMRSGDFSARPLNDFNCRKCHEHPFCPYVQQ